MAKIRLGICIVAILLCLSVSNGDAQSHNFPALDTTNVFSGTNIFTGELTAGPLSASSVTVQSLTTTGPGWTKTVQCQTAPANPPVGSITFYCDSGTGLFTTLKSDGTSANPGGATWGAVTSGTNSNSGSFAASGNSWDFSGTTIFKLRIGAGLTSSANGDCGYDTTNKMWHCWQNAADNFLFTGSAAGSYTDQDCVKFTKSGSTINIADSGGACGGSGSASPIVFSCGQAPSGTATQFCGVGFLSSTESGTQTPVPRSGTVSNLQCRNGTSLSSSQTLTMTVRKGAAATGTITSSSTALTCAVNSTNTNGCSDGTHNFTVAAGDVLDIQTVPTNTPSPGNLSCSVQLL